MSEKLTPQQLVSQQLSQLTQLETLLDTEKDVLQQQNPDALIQLTADKNDLLLAIQRIDNAIGQSFEFKQEKLAGKFTSLLSDIEAILVRCKKQNQINGLIIQQSQLSVERMKTSLLENHNKSSMTYNSKGKTSGGLSSLGIKA
ncbi:MULTISPECIES: flagella synthesis protein FlgN [unclassified Colwellia]|uniref:flagella synthesis protein FlgN n=1 Tax=unclassified Colwellia TaxID=196834 RepID=UPI0015F3ADB5|nr:MULTISPECIES: flagellar export chaperone FlgN [unclassified Colwellia]MBA6222849.1 flagellar protein FlgN [Colwellia sp. MB3u-45]MBA6267279.1 flagellar protein FlgN [Colwellia sp. MB3u-43]MBA6290032.1 flagellar protein FlgN [Colwellia sp. MB3u-4]MBA6296910.1 flagellar protein FlgN [Colwellia sp. MB02u-9]MBA6319759.1 flagellar protein FlgN [Colwellia sp. MB02u-19]